MGEVSGSACWGRRGGARAPLRRWRRLGVAAAVLAVAGAGVGPLVGEDATAAAVSAVSFAGSSMEAGATATWTVGFTSGSGVPAAGTISVTFASGFAIPSSPTVTLGTGYTGTCSSPTASTSGTTVTVTLPSGCSLGAGGNGTLTIAGITNPAAGSYPATSFSVKTSTDGAAVSPTAAVVIDGISAVSFAGSSTEANAAGTTWTVAFTAGAGGVPAAGTISVTFASGFAIPSSPTVTLTGAGYTGSCSSPAASTSGTTVTVTLPSGCSLGAGGNGTLTIAGITNPAAGSYPATSFSVKTSTDPATVSPAGPVLIGAPTGVFFFGNSEAAAVTTTWTVAFTVGTTLPAGDAITVTFPALFSFTSSTPAITLVDFSGGASCNAPTSAAAANVVTVTLPSGCSLLAGTAGGVQVAGVINGPANLYPGTAFSVATTTDPTPGPMSQNVTITGGIHLVFSTEPGDGAAGAPLAPQPVVSVENAANSVITSGPDATDTITLAIKDNPSNGTLTCAAQAAVAGVARFTNCSINSAGSGYTLVATDATNGAVTSALSTPFDVVPGTPLPLQLYGTNAIGTSIAVSEEAFPANGSAGCVVLARDDFFSDALAGGPLAASCDGPLLLTEGAPESASLDPATEAEIERVLPSGGTVYVLGGDLALSPNIDTTLAGLGYAVVRLAGVDEWDTAIKIAEQLGNPSTVFEATGYDFYDALSAEPAAIADHGAILLTQGATQDPETALYLAGHPGDTRYAIGGPDAALGADPSAIGVWGPTLYDTSAAVAETFFPGATTFGAATAFYFADALTGGVFMTTGGRMGPMLLVESPPFAPSIVAYLNSLAVGTQGYVFGGPAALGPDVLAALQADVG